jgi:hypothetical protein
MRTGEGRSPRPPGGDPNVKSLQISLTPGEWRDLRLLAAKNGTGVAEQVMRIIRVELRSRSGAA